MSSNSNLSSNCFQTRRPFPARTFCKDMGRDAWSCSSCCWVFAAINFAMSRFFLRSTLPGTRGYSPVHSLLPFPNGLWCPSGGRPLTPGSKAALVYGKSPLCQAVYFSQSVQAPPGIHPLNEELLFWNQVPAVYLVVASQSDGTLVWEEDASSIVSPGQQLTCHVCAKDPGGSTAGH